MASMKSFSIHLLIYSVISWLASVTLTLERLNMFKDPDYVPSCDFGLFVSCSSVMKTEQAAILGFPNPLLGVVGFAVTATIAIFMLMLNGKLIEPLPRWFHISLQVAATLALVIVAFFWKTSVITLMLLCPWCMIVWAMVIPMFLKTTAYNASNGYLGAKLVGFGQFLSEWWIVTTISFYAFIIASIFIRFHEYIL